MLKMKIINKIINIATLKQKCSVQKIHYIRIERQSENGRIYLQPIYPQNTRVHKIFFNAANLVFLKKLNRRNEKKHTNIQLTMK